MTSRLAFPAALLVLSVALVGCSARTAALPADESQSSQNDSSDAEPVGFGECSSDTTAALAAQNRAEATTDLAGLTDVVPAPSCMILKDGNYLAYYLEASQADFDQLSTTLHDAGYEVEPKELDQSVKDTYGYIGYFDYRMEGVGQGSATYISQAPYLSIDVPHIFLAWYPFG